MDIGRKDQNCVVCGGVKAFRPLVYHAHDGAPLPTPLLPKLVSQRQPTEIVLDAWCSDCGIMYHPESIP